MAAPSAADVIRGWERAEGASGLDRAGALLALAVGLQGPQAPATLTVGRRNAALLELRRALFGEVMRVRASCPRCGLELEAGLEIGPMLAAPALDRVFLRLGDVDVYARVPTDADLRAALQRRWSAAELARSCVTEGQDQTARSRRARSGASRRTARPEDLDEGQLMQLSEHLLQADPLALIELGLACEGCGEAWSSPLDVAEHLFAELRVYAGRLLEEVHTLAAAYGWSEETILALSPRRRQVYLELVRR